MCFTLVVMKSAAVLQIFTAAASRTSHLSNFRQHFLDQIMKLQYHHPIEVALLQMTYIVQLRKAEAMLIGTTGADLARHREGMKRLMNLNL